MSSLRSCSSYQDQSHCTTIPPSVTDSLLDTYCIGLQWQVMQVLVLLPQSYQPLHIFTVFCCFESCFLLKFFATMFSFVAQTFEEPEKAASVSQLQTAPNPDIFHAKSSTWPHGYLHLVERIACATYLTFVLPGTVFLKGSKNLTLKRRGISKRRQLPAGA